MQYGGGATDLVTAGFMGMEFIHSEHNDSLYFFYYRYEELCPFNGRYYFFRLGAGVMGQGFIIFGA